MIKKFKLLQLLFCLTVLPLSATQSDEIRVVTEYRGFYQQQNIDGSLGGYATEVVKALFAITGDTPMFEIHTWARSFSEAEKYKNVMIYSLALSADRKKRFSCVGELGSENLYLWGVNTGKNVLLNTEEELQGYQIAVSKLSSTDQYLTKQKLGSLQRVGSHEQALGMLFKNRVDLVVGTEEAITTRSKRLGYDSSELVKVFHLKALSHKLCISFNKDSDKQLVDRFRNAFDTLQSNGTISAIQQRWNVSTP